MTTRDGVKLSGTIIVLLIVGVLIFLGLRNREKPVPYEPPRPRTPITERKVRTPRKPKVVVSQDTASTNAAAEETISMRQLKHERAVMFLPEGDPIPGFDTKGLVEDTMAAFRSNAPTEKKLELMNQIALIGDKMVMPAVLAALEDKDEEVRTLAVEAMKAIDDPAVVEGVEKALKDSSLWIEGCQCLHVEFLLSVTVESLGDEVFFTFDVNQPARHHLYASLGCHFVVGHLQFCR